MPYLGQFYLHEQLLGARILPDPNRPISRHRIPLGTVVRKSILGLSFPKPRTTPPWGGHKIQKWPKEVTYQISNGGQQRKRYAVTFCPTSPDYDRPWKILGLAITAWSELSAEQKAELNRRALIHNTMSGYNLFIREYIRANY